MERVIVIKNDSPIVLVSPHTEENIAFITESIAETINCSCIINKGWKRAKNYDYDASQANCNYIPHLNQDVVRQEFLEPIIKIAHEINNSMAEANFFFLHGMGDSKQDIDGVVGYGTETNASCELWKKNAFLYCTHLNKMKMCQGKEGGDYSGASYNNLNQLFRQHYQGIAADCMQLELVRSLRNSKEIADLTIDTLSQCFEDFLEIMAHLEDADHLPKRYSLNWETIGENTPEY